MHDNFAPKGRVSTTFKISFLLIMMLLPSYYITTAYAPVDPLTRGTDSQSSSPEASTDGKPEQHPVERGSSPASETRRVLVILTRLKDKNNLTSAAEMNSLVFTAMRSYFKEASYDKMNLTGDTTDWMDINNNTADYGRDTGTSYTGIDDTDGDGIPDSWKLIRDAINLIDGSMNFTQYDEIIVVHSGGDQAKTHNSNDIWSSQYTGLEIATNDGITIDEAVLIAETDPMGIFAHEFGHQLGLPDLYNTSGGPEYVGLWDLMARGAWLPSDQGTSPSHPTSWSKSKLGWISENATAIGRSMEEVIDPLEIQGSNLTVLKIPVTTQTYYLIEVRIKTGYDSYLPSTGVLILYIDESRPSGEGIVTVKYSQSLNEATYTAEGGNNMFVDDERNINLTVVAEYSSSYKVNVSLIRADKTPPRANVTSPVPSGWLASRPAIVSAIITDTGLSSSSIKNASILYSSDGRRTWNRIQMIPGDNDVYSGVIPSQNSSTVEYYVEAYDYAGNVAVAKNGNSPFIYGSTAQLIEIMTVVFMVALLVFIAIMYVRTSRKSQREQEKAIFVARLYESARRTSFK